MLEIIKPNKKINIRSIDNLEKKFNIKLPEDYKQFLLKYNGGYPEYSFYFDTKTEVFESLSILSFREFSLIKYQIERYTKNPDDDFLGLIKNNIITFALSSSNHDLGIGVGNKNNGKIYIIDGEIIMDKVFVTIANSFSEFMQGFRYVDMDIYIENEKNKNEKPASFKRISNLFEEKEIKAYNKNITTKSSESKKTDDLLNKNTSQDFKESNFVSKIKKLID